jgi:hypothetical protein
MSEKSDLIKQLSPVPLAGDDLVDLLTFLYPPRCKEPGETLEEHMLYAGKVQLIQMLSEAYKLEAEIERNKKDANCPEFSERWTQASVVVQTRRDD